MCFDTISSHIDFWTEKEILNLSSRLYFCPFEVYFMGTEEEFTSNSYTFWQDWKIKMYGLQNINQAVHTSLHKPWNLLEIQILY